VHAGAVSQSSADYLSTSQLRVYAWISPHRRDRWFAYSQRFIIGLCAKSARRVGHHCFPLRSVEILTQVHLIPPGPTLSVFQPGSSSPAAILYDAMEQFDRKSPKADEAVRSIKTDLADAVDTCVEAAGLETDAVWQKKLLKVWEKKSRSILDHGKLMLTLNL
jgi:hypothetical protein